MSRADTTWLRWSVVFVWLATAVVSLLEFRGQSAVLLATAGITDPHIVTALIAAGAGADVLVGVAMAVRPSRIAYWAALALMTTMTLVASVLDPSLWLHPLGPLTKNVPIAAALWLLIRNSK